MVCVTVGLEKVIKPLLQKTSDRTVKRDGEPGEPPMSAGPGNENTGARGATHVVDGGPVYGVRYPQFQSPMELGENNRAFVDEGTNNETT